ncbi:hypothetical protein GO755_26555 [Spirosoma sp. HMF4905]|uniref:Uncharacterized protein n=1 Tax=Spirosoma arboris TaxID=2682092 RepID=A0A7K1SIS4_9BACT|nr:hypothetical protein [Spirosoma arboris]MVM33628.1 hypothetical protein [Spirosoma arboris]
MKFELNINQRAIMEHGFDLDMVDGAIIDFCLNFSKTCWSWVEEGTTYYWFQHDNICTQLPMLKLKRDTMYRRMKALCDKEFLKAHPRNKQQNQSWYALCPNSYLIESTIGKKSDGTDENPKGSLIEPQTIGSESEPSDQNPKAIGKESEGASDQNPMYKRIIEEENNLNLTKKNAGEAEILEVDAEEIDAENAPNPQFRAPPFPTDDLSEADLAELDEFTKKLHSERRVIEHLSKHHGLRGEAALQWISLFVSEQWATKNLTTRSYPEVLKHCLNWIKDQLLRLQADEQRQSKPTNHRQSGNRQSTAETGAGIDGLAERYFGT